MADMTDDELYAELAELFRTSPRYRNNALRAGPDSKSWCYYLAGCLTAAVRMKSGQWIDPDRAVRIVTSGVAARLMAGEVPDDESRSLDS